MISIRQNHRSLYFFCLMIAMLFGLSSQGYAGDSTKTPVITNVRFLVNTTFAYNAPLANYYYQPYYLSSARAQALSNGLVYVPTARTDFTNIHGVAYSKLGVEVTVLNAIVLREMNVIEHRGMSYGITNTNVIAFFPQLFASIDTSFVLGEERFKFGLHVGYFENSKINEGLFIYNIDAQGGYTYFQWRNFRLNLTIHGDYIEWVGLNLGDLGNISLSVRDVKIGDVNLNGQVGAYAFLNSNALYYFQSYFTINNFVGSYSLDGLYFNTSASLQYKSLRFYGEYAYRYALIPLSFTALSGVVGGMEYQVEHKWNDEFGLWFYGRAEYRYYGSGVNIGFKDNSVAYVPPSGVSTSAKKNYYLLSWYERPFSQWAVFTSYYATNVYAATAYLQARFTFYKHFELWGTVDFNYITATGLVGFMYPFYTIGLSWNFAKEAQFNLYMTNKEMNYYTSYPTFVFLTTPTFGLSLKINFDYSIKNLFLLEAAAESLMNLFKNKH